MSTDALTDLAIRGLAPEADRRTELFDAKIPGFAVRVFPSGIKSFVVFYRHKGRLRRLTLGRYPVLSLSDARRLAREALHKVTHGDDPQVHRTAGRVQYRFSAVVDDFLEAHCARHNRAVTARETERLLRSCFAERWGVRDIREISKGDVIQELEAIVARGTHSTANHALAAVRKLFNWCVERNVLEVSPCAGVKPPASHKSRERVLSEEELAAVWRASLDLGYPFGHLVGLLLLTAQRRGEVAGLRWSELDITERTWAIPKERTKNNRAHIVPLSSVAECLVGSLPKLNDELVFPSRGSEERTFSGFSKSKRRLDEIAGVVGWTLHDLRRSVATHLARLGVLPHVVERILNHTTGTLGGVAGIYNRFQYLPEMRAALELWAQHVSKIASSTSKI
jgi:integrase